MTQGPRYTPYANGVRPFSIAMSPLDPGEWLLADALRAEELSQKAEIFLRDGDDAFRADPATEDAQAEALELVAAFSAAAGWPSGPPAPAQAPALMRAALMVQDDLIVMRQREGTWHFVAGALCFPSAWSLAEKFGEPLNGLHADVPGWKGPMAMRVSRIFDNLPPGQIVWRLNWSVQSGAGLRMPKSKHAGARPIDIASAHIRVERQTLRKLPRSGDILFTVKILLDPLAAFATYPDGARCARALMEQIAALDADEVDYKGLTAQRPMLLQRLSEIAGVAGAAQSASL